MKIGIILFALLLAGSSIAQGEQGDVGPETDDCKKYRSLYFEYLKQGMYKDARTFWLNAYTSCGGEGNMDERFYTNGRVIYTELEKMETGQKPEELRDSIYWIYEQGMNIISDPEWELDFGKRLVDDKDGRTSQIDSLFENIDSLKSETNPVYIYTYFKHLIINHFGATEETGRDAKRKMIEGRYFTLSKYILEGDKKLSTKPDPKLQKQYDYCRTFINKYFLKLYGSGELLKIPMEEAFDDLSTDEWLRMKQIENRLGLMDEKGSTKSGTYGRYVQESVRLAPSATGYFGLANMSYSEGDYKQTIAHLELAMKLDSSENADEYLLLLASAQYGNKQYGAAFNTAEKIKGKLRGKGMVICAKSIAATANSCGESSFDRAANYWLANDYMIKAKELGESVNTSTYLSNAPSADDCFNQNVKKDDVLSCSCWGKTTVVRY